MGKILKSYLYSFIHPFQYASYIGHDLRNEEKLKEWQRKGVRALDSWESIAIAWGFKILSALFLLMLFRFGFLLNHIHPNLSLSLTSKAYVVFLGIGVVFFPIQAGLGLLIWKFVLRVTLPLFMDDDEIEIHLDKVLAHSFSSYAVLTIPVIGGVLQKLLWGMYMFSGLKHVYRLSNAQALAVFSLFTTLVSLTVASILLGLYTVFSL